MKQKRYKIWKASINEFRVLDTLTEKVEVLDKFTALGCSLHVDLNKYNEAKALNFKDSGRTDDYFAWIECNALLRFNNERFNDNLFYNPFKSEYFKDRTTNETLTFVAFIEINGNILNYHKS